MVKLQIGKIYKYFVPGLVYYYKVKHFDSDLIRGDSQYANILIELLTRDGTQSGNPRRRTRDYQAMVRNSYELVESEAYMVELLYGE